MAAGHHPVKKKSRAWRFYGGSGIVTPAYEIVKLCRSPATFRCGMLRPCAQGQGAVARRPPTNPRVPGVPPGPPRRQFIAAPLRSRALNIVVGSGPPWGELVTSRDIGEGMACLEYACGACHLQYVWLSFQAKLSRESKLSNTKCGVATGHPNVSVAEGHTSIIRIKASSYQ